MRLATCSLASAAGAIRILDPDAVVSAFSPGRPLQAMASRPHLRLCFRDVETPSSALRDAPTERQVAAFLDFVSGAHGNLLIHCHAGLSRSPALAIIALAARGRDPVEACALVRAAVPEASPNRLVLALAGRILGVDMVAAASGFAFRRGPAGALGAETGLRLVLT